MFTVISLIVFASVNAFAADCMPCHSNLAESEYVHYPSGDNKCEICHAVKQEHRTRQRREDVTTDRSNDTCFNCHSPKDSSPVVHGAIQKKESCIFCHNPHASTRRSFLRAEPGKLCVSCHSNLIPAGTTKHGALELGRSCLNCHVPHSSSTPTLLTAQGGNCLSCHDKEMGQAPNMAKVIGDLPLSHKPVKEGKCVACHTPHASRFLPLLKDESQNESNAGKKTYWDDNLVKICLQCHGAAVSTEFVTKNETRFRSDAKGDAIPNGKIVGTNLHHLHVVKKGKDCAECHDVHGGSNPHNIASDDSPRKHRKFELSVTPTGGTCAHACHGNANYNRMK
ncbi:cytochrome c3 family protein [Bdellovibrionota bacterium FG-2]